MAHPRIAIAPNDDPRWQQAKDGDLAARNSLVEEHIRLLDQVTAVVCAKLPTYASREDIWSFGSFGLIRAVETYDPSIASFRTHAVFLIKARIYDELRSMDWVPKAVRKKIRDVEQAEIALTNTSAQTVNSHEVAAAMGVDTEYVLEARQARRASTVQPLDTVVDIDAIHLRTSPQDAFSVTEYLQTFSAWLDTLDESDQAVWSLRFYCRMTTKEVAAHLGVPVAAVAQSSSRIFQSFHSYVDTMLVAS